jgi:ketosteroid isomerase-like protein
MTRPWVSERKRYAFFIGPRTLYIVRVTSLTENQRTIEKYMAGFRVSDHEQVLSCLTDDVQWEIPGMFHSKGKAAFDKEIENEAFVGHPDIAVSRLIEEGDIVVAEGSVRAQKRDGGTLSLRFCDVFVMQAAKIKRLTSYLMEIK